MRENVQRRIVVQCNVSGRDLRSVVDDIQQRVGSAVSLPQGYHIEYGGQFESEAQASRQLLWLSLGVIIAIFFVLMSAFGARALNGWVVLADLLLVGLLALDCMMRFSQLLEGEAAEPFGFLEWMLPARFRQGRDD